MLHTLLSAAGAKLALFDVFGLILKLMIVFCGLQ
jgi:hypothetical protein